MENGDDGYVLFRNKETGEMCYYYFPMFKKESIESLLDEQWEITDWDKYFFPYKNTYKGRRVDKTKEVDIM